MIFVTVCLHVKFAKLLVRNDPSQGRELQVVIAAPGNLLPSSAVTQDSGWHSRAEICIKIETSQGHFVRNICNGINDYYRLSSCDVPGVT